MIAVHIRRFAVQKHQETGRSIQEILIEIVNALRTGKVDFRARSCPLCNSVQNIVTSTRDLDGAVIRRHQCSFCGWTFWSEETKPVQVTNEAPKTIVKRRKKK